MASVAQNPIVPSRLGSKTGLKSTVSTEDIDDTLLASLGYKQGQFTASLSPAQGTHDQQHAQSSNATLRLWKSSV